MPIYEYRCTACQHEMEALQKFSDPPLTTCPSCHAQSLVKKISAAGFHLKGTGWYATDFKGSSKPATPSASSAPSSGSEAGAGKGASDSAGTAKAENTSGASTSSTTAVGSSTGSSGDS